jgi:hypothetical protein
MLRRPSALRQACMHHRAMARAAMIRIAATATSGFAANVTIGGMTTTEIRTVPTSARMLWIIGVLGVVDRTV